MLRGCCMIHRFGEAGCLLGVPRHSEIRKGSLPLPHASLRDKRPKARLATLLKQLENRKAGAWSSLGGNAQAWALVQTLYFWPSVGTMIHCILKWPEDSLWLKRNSNSNSNYLLLCRKNSSKSECTWQWRQRKGTGDVLALQEMDAEKTGTHNSHGWNYSINCLVWNAGAFDPYLKPLLSRINF